MADSGERANFWRELAGRLGDDMRKYVDDALAPFRSGLAQLTNRLDTLAANTKSVSIEDLRPIIAAEVAEAAKSISDERNVNNAPRDDLRKYVDDVLAPIRSALPELTKRLDTLAANTDSVSIEDLRPIIAAEVAEAAKSISDEWNVNNAPRDDLRKYVEDVLAPIRSALPELTERLDTLAANTNSVSIEDLRPVIAAEVADAVESLAAQWYADAPSLEDFRESIADHVDRAVSALPKAEHGNDGVGLAGALIGRGGELIVSLSDGTTRDLGRVVGDNGKNGFGFDDLEVVHDGERTITLRFTRSDEVKEFPLTVPAMIYRGVWREQATYCRGDTVTWGGSVWHCDVDETRSKPDAKEKHWTLAVKRGLHGKDLR